MARWLGVSPSSPTMQRPAVNHTWHDTESPLSAPRLVCTWEPCSSSGRWLHQDGSFSLSTRCRKNMQIVIAFRLEIAHLGPPLLRWRSDDFSRLKCLGAISPETRVYTFRLEAFDASLGIREGSLALLLPHNAPRNRSIFTSHDWPR